MPKNAEVLSCFSPKRYLDFPISSLDGYLSPVTIYYRTLNRIPHRRTSDVQKLLDDMATH